MMVYLDTHVVVMATQPVKLPRKVVALMRRASVVRISPASLLELRFLREVGRLNVGPDAFVEALSGAFEFEICPRAFGDVATAALKFGWTRDPFDRLIVAQASLARSTLITKDRLILENYAHARWD